MKNLLLFFPCLQALEKKINCKSVAKLLVKFFPEKTIYCFVKEQMELISEISFSWSFCIKTV